MDWWVLIDLAIANFLGIRYGIWLERRRNNKKQKSEYPYSWACSEKTCTFSIHSVNEKLVKVVAASHNGQHAQDILRKRSQSGNSEVGPAPEEGGT